MMGRGDWQKLENQINGVLRPLGARVEALESKVADLEAALEATRVTQKTSEKPQKA